MDKGIVVRAYGGFYYVKIDQTVWECKLRGRFRLERERILVGDHVKIAPLSPGKGVVEQVLPRTTVLQRPLIANVEQVVIVMSVHSPTPNLGLLDRMLILVEYEGLNPLIGFNKIDLGPTVAWQALCDIYTQAGYSVVATSAVTGHGVKELRKDLQAKLTVLAGPSGVGKSSLLNAIQPGLALRTGEVSRKLGQGRHTTRFVELLSLDGGGLIADSPGFNILALPAMKREALSSYFRELAPFIGTCRFNTCLHHKEPGCSVKQAVEQGQIHPDRYQSYLNLLQEVIENEQRY